MLPLAQRSQISRNAMVIPSQPWLACADTDLVKLSADLSIADAVFSHPRHLAAQQTLAELITQLRAARNIDDGYELQQALLDQRLESDESYLAFRQAAIRVRTGRPPQDGAPTPTSGLDPNKPEAWELERDICERVARQYRCVGDALAWRVFGFQRKEIIALSQSAPPGLIAGKKGLQAELHTVAEAREEGKFALLHDLTNCLRIGDITVFSPDGTTWDTIEVKSNPNRSASKQRRRIKAAVDAVRNGGPLPNQDRRTVLYDLDVPFNTHLEILRDGTRRATSDGIFAARVPGDRALLVTDFLGCNAQGWTDEQYQERIEKAYAGALRRANLTDDPEWLITATSMDLVSRDPVRVPFAAYPLHPVICARIIGDYTVFNVITSGPALEDSMRRAGIEARWVRPPGSGELTPGEVVMEMTARTSFPVPEATARILHRPGLRAEHVRTLQMRRSELDMYLIQLLDQNTWLQGVNYMLADPLLNRRPWPHFRGEDNIWA